MLKIAHLTSAHPRFDIRIFAKMCKSVALSGWTCMLVVADGKGDAVADGVSIYDAGASKGRFERIFLTTRRVYRKALTLNADIYHLHDPELLVVGYLLHKAGKKVIFDSHETVHLQIFDKQYLGITRWPIAFIYKWLERFICKKLSAVIGATPAISGYFQSQNIAAVNVNNYPHADEFASADDITSEADWSKRNYLTFVGVMTKERGLQEAIGAIELAHSPVKLALIGNVSDKDLKTLFDQSPKTDFLGWKNRQELPEIFAKTLAGLVVFWPMKNHIESQPNKLFEYMAAGLPVIASDFPLWRQIVGNADCGLLVNPHDPVEIATAVDYLANHPQEAERLGANGRYAVREIYNWQAEEKKLVELYKNVGLKST